jgi:hypothetical protein
MSQFEHRCSLKSSYKEISGHFTSILKLHDKCKDLDDSDFRSFKKECIQLKKQIQLKYKQINNGDKNISKICNHYYIVDYIDITPDRGQNIKYCTKCFETCD